jgi:hypothetical protein
MSAGASCASCRHFVDEPAKLESLLPGMNALGSAFGSVRDRDGLCAQHQRYLRATCRCALHEPAARTTPTGTR